MCAPAWQVSLRLGKKLNSVALDVLCTMHRPLFEIAASLDQQLVALHQRCNSSRGSGAGSASSLPTVNQLQAAWATLVIALAPGRVREGLPQAELAAVVEQAAHHLMALQPDNPRSSFELGSAAGLNDNAGSVSALRDPLPFFRRGAELARVQGSDFWLARWAGPGASG